MKFEIIYKLDMTIEEDRLVPKTTIRRTNKNPKGKTLKFKGNKEEIKRELCNQIDELADNLEKWYFGEE